MAKVKYSEFVDALDAAATLDGTETVVVIQDGVPVESTTQDIADLGGGGASAYLVYTALLTQTSTDAPVATVLQNTLSGAIVWTRNDVGDYVGTLSGAFDATKTLFLIGPNPPYRTYLSVATSNTVSLAVLDENGAAADDVMYLVSVEIRVYP